MARRVTKIQAHCRQKHPIDARLFVEHLVPSIIPMPMIANDRMADLVQVPSDLMPTTRLRPDLQE